MVGLITVWLLSEVSDKVCHKSSRAESPGSGSGQWPVYFSVSRLIIVIGMRRGMREVGEAGAAVYTTHSPGHVICHSLIANTMQSHKLPVKVESSHVNILLF